MATLRELKGRIGSVASSEKITGAMKMISSAKMHKAELALRRLRPYRDCIRDIIANLLESDAPVSSPLTEVPRQTSDVTLVVLGSDDGLCGAYNVNLAKALASHIESLRSLYGPELRIHIIPVGKKMLKATAKMESEYIDVTTANVSVNSKSDGAAVKAFMETLRDRFTSGSTQRIDVAYMNFVSAGRQRPLCRQFLPLQPEAIAGGQAKSSGKPYIFEPDAETIFATALPMFLLSDMQDAFAENRASEQAARVMAMQSSNDNAKKLLEQLNLEYNKLRQQGITSELLDIVGGQTRD